MKPKTSEQDLNFWTPLFGGIYVAGYNPVTIDMQGHRLDVAMNMDPVAKGTVFNPGAISPHAIHVTSSSLTINNVKGMELSAAGPGLATGNITVFILLAPTSRAPTMMVRAFPALLSTMKKVGIMQLNSIPASFRWKMAFMSGKTPAVPT